MTPDERQEEYVRILVTLEDEFDRYDYLLNRALSEEAAFDERLRSDENSVQGCQSKLWVEVSIKAGKLKIRCDSDALIVKGLANMIAELFTGLEPEEALHTTVWFLDKVGLDRFLVERRSGLNKMIEEIYAYALKQLDKSEEMQSYDVRNCKNSGGALVE